jgi:broad specificity phosphatase PhoE
MNDRKIIYIRHGKDAVDEYKYDEILTDKGKIAVKHLTKKLIKEHGVPDIIYYSPYYRTRQTKNIMLKTIKKYFNRDYPPYECDNRLSRFFTEKQSRNPDIRSDTIKKGAPVYETWEEFNARVKEQVDEMENSNKTNNYKVIWCVTHTLILDYLIRNKELDRDHHIPYLDTIVISK